MVMPVVTMACSWYGHSSTLGTTIYLKEARSKSALLAGEDELRFEGARNAPVAKM